MILPPHAHQFPQLPRGVARNRREDHRAGRPERRRQDQSDRGHFISCAGPRFAPRHSRRGGVQRGRRLLGGRRRNRRRAGPRHARHRHRAAGSKTARRLQRKCRIDREPVGSAAAFADHLRVVWLVPAMDTLFAGAPSERRRFLDRLVLAVDAEHGSRVNALERSLRSRNRLLEEPRPDPHWLDAVEHETAELAVAVAGLRVETVRRLDGRAGEPQGLGISAGRDRARRLDGEADPRPSRPSKSRSAIARCCATIAPATPPRAARSTVRI